MFSIEINNVFSLQTKKWKNNKSPTRHQQCPLDFALKNNETPENHTTYDPKTEHQQKSESFVTHTTNQDAFAITVDV